MLTTTLGSERTSDADLERKNDHSVPNHVRVLDLNDPALTFGVALAAGMTAQVLARHLRVPGIAVLLIAGVLLGPDVANLVRPQTLGVGLSLIVGAAVAVILFEGGMHLELARLRREALTIRRLVTIGAVVTAVGGTLAARYIMQWDWQVAVPFGTLVIVTGPTVITPLLRRIRVTRKLHVILEAEGVLIDPIGAIIAVVALEVVLTQELGIAARGLLGIPTRLMFGAVAGAVGGFIMAKLLSREDIIPEGLESVFTLGLLLALYASCEAVLPESGIMAAPIAGMVVGNMPSRPSRELKEFKEQLTVLLIGLLFVLLAADVRVSEVTGLGWRGAATVAVLMVVVRPLNVIASTVGSDLTTRERLFMMWMGPRGIVAAAVASLFAAELARHGIEEGFQLRALVFLTIAATVFIEGIGGGAIASLLHVRRRSDVGYVIAGAHRLARAVAGALRAGGEEIVIVDTDAAEIAAAREEGFQAILGNALHDNTLANAEIDARRGVIGVIRNEGVSLLLAEKARREFRVRHAYVAMRARDSGVPWERLQASGARPLFGREVDLDYWTAQLAGGRAAVHSLRYAGAQERDLHEVIEPAHRSSLLPLVISRRGRTEPVDDHTRLRRNDILVLLTSGTKRPALADMEEIETPLAETSGTA